MSNRMWESLAEHSKTCVLSEMLYVYYPEDSVGVVFNNIYEFSGLISGKQYYSANSLSDNQKVCLLGLLLLIDLHLLLLSYTRKIVKGYI